MHLQLALNLLAWTHLVAGELTAAVQLFEEDRLIAEATGNPPVAYNEMMLAAGRGQEAHASELIQATLQKATAGGLGVVSATYASSVLYNRSRSPRRRARRRLAGIRARSSGIRALPRV